MNISKYAKEQFKLAVLFGLISLLLGMIQFSIPGMQGGMTDMREIPLLISLFYLTNPFYIIITCLITAIGSAEGGSLLSFLLMHFIPLFIGWFVYNKFSWSKMHPVALLLFWSVFTLVYYVVFMIPINLIINKMIGIDSNKDIWLIFLSILPFTKFEIIYTALISGLYLIQLNTRKSLEIHQTHLEDLIDHRTSDLAKANLELKEMNKELLSTNNEIKELNTNLDEIVGERTKKVQTQLSQLLKYTHINSHDVRAPLSRIQGLIPLIMSEKDSKSKNEMLIHLQNASDELDQIIKEMNKILEAETLQ